MQKIFNANIGLTLLKVIPLVISFLIISTILYCCRMSWSMLNLKRYQMSWFSQMFTILSFTPQLWKLYLTWNIHMPWLCNSSLRRGTRLSSTYKKGMTPGKLILYISQWTKIILQECVFWQCVNMILRGVMEQFFILCFTNMFWKTLLVL